MVIYFTCYLADGTKRTHSYEFQAKSREQLDEFLKKLVDGIASKLEQGLSLPMPRPATCYAPGQVKYVEIGFAEDAKELEQAMGKVVDRKLGFLKE